MLILALPLMVIPPVVVLACVVFAAVLGRWVYRGSHGGTWAEQRFLFWGLTLVQVVIVLPWVFGMTPGAWLRARCALGVVIDPAMEDWLVWVLVSMMAGWAWLTYKDDRRPHRRDALSLVAVEAFVLLMLYFNVNHYERLTGWASQLPSSISPDGTRELSVVVLDRLLGVHHVILARSPGSPLLYPVAEVEDDLRRALQSGARFTWYSPTHAVFETNAGKPMATIRL